MFFDAHAFQDDLFTRPTRVHPVQQLEIIPAVLAPWVRSNNTLWEVMTLGM